MTRPGFARESLRGRQSLPRIRAFGVLFVLAIVIALLALPSHAAYAAVNQGGLHTGGSQAITVQRSVTQGLVQLSSFKASEEEWGDSLNLYDEKGDFGPISSIAGIAYDKQARTLRLNSYKNDNAVLQLYNMGSVDIEVTGDCSLCAIHVTEDGLVAHDATVRLTGGGILTLNGQKSRLCPIELYAIASGKSSTIRFRAVDTVSCNIYAGETGDCVSVKNTKYGSSTYDETTDKMTYVQRDVPSGNIIAFDGSVPNYQVSSALDGNYYVSFLRVASFKQVGKGLPVASDTKASTPAETKAPSVGDTFAVGGITYKITSTKRHEVAVLRAPKAKSSVTIPKLAKLKGVASFKVTGIARNAFKGSKAKTVVVKTPSLTKKSVKGAFARSKVKTVKVKIGTKKQNKKYAKKYKSAFSRKNCGVKVSVK